MTHIDSDLNNGSGDADRTSYHRRAVHLLLTCTLTALATGCTASPDSPDSPTTDIPSVLAPSVPTSSPPAAQGSSPHTTPTPSMPQSPSCKLLATRDVATALGVQRIELVSGMVFPKAPGPAGNPLIMDTCTWQAAASTPSALVQVQVYTAKTVQAADHEYTEIIRATQENTAPNAQPAPVSSLGDEAAFLPEWIIARNDDTILTVSIGGLDSHKNALKEPLTRLARQAAQHLNWPS